MPIIVTMSSPHEPDQPNAAGGGEPRQQDGITPERLHQVIRRLETGFYDTSDVREQIARRVRKELDR
jgi:hypothetical protein